MNKKILLFVFLSIFLFFSSQANWNLTPTGFQDNFNGVYFSNASGFQNHGLLTGDNGWYYTQTGASGTWVRFNITGNSADSLIYNHSQFYKISSGMMNNLVHIVGRDTVAGKAVIFTFNLSTLAYTHEYTGDPGSKLNSVLARGTSAIYACGDDGLIVRKYMTGPYLIELSPTTADLFSVTNYAQDLILFSGDEVFLNGLENGTLSLTATLAPGNFFKASLYNSSRFYLAGNGYSRLQTFSTGLETLNNYDFGPLNCTGIAVGNSCNYTATDHGIFRSLSTNYSIMEYQPSSNAANLNDIRFVNSSSSTGFACGDNGLLLTTSDGGGHVKPYCSFTSNGGCKGSVIYVPGNWGSGTSCQWKLNNVQISTACTLNYTINTSGLYQLDYIVYNSSSMLYDTASQMINIVDTPLVNLPVLINDSILCRDQPLGITLQNTQLNTEYDFRKTTSSSSLGTGTGNGGVLNFYSDTGLVTGSYRIFSMSTIANCSVGFSNTIPISVEKTEASFHASLINAEPGEPISFYGTSYDSQHYQWTFGSNAGITSSNLQNVLNNSFSSTGNAFVQLINWSDNGCYDTLIVNEPMIYNEPMGEDTCWAFNNDEIDLPWNGHYIDRIYQTAPTQNGFLVCGSANEQQLHSRYGVSPPRSTGGGAYLAKYSYNGTVKWVITSYDSLYQLQTIDRPRISSVVTDANGNIYATGVSFSYSYFTDNSGYKVRLAYNANNNNGMSYNGFVAKFDSTGKYIWSTQIKSAWTSSIILDSNNDLALVGITSNLSWYCNQNIVDTIIKHNMPGSASNNFILKIDTSGNYLWSAHIYGIYSPRMLRNIGYDNFGNLYVSGMAEGMVVFFDAGLNASQADSMNIPCSYIAKYNSSGLFQWKTIFKELPMNGIGIPYCSTRSMTVDADGNSYATGRVSIGLFDSLSVISPSGNVRNASVGEYFLIKTDSSGENVWITGKSGTDIACGFSVFTTGPDVYTIGEIWNDTGSTTVWTGQMLSTDGNHQNITIGRADVFIARYDSSGVLNYVTKSGNNPYNGFPSNENGSVFVNPDNHLFFSIDINGTSPPLPITYFNDTFAPNEYDGVIAKMGIIPCNLNTEIEESIVNNKKSIRIFPNPTNSVLNIYFDSSYISRDKKILTITNTLGSIVFSKEIMSNEYSIDLQNLHLTSNIYFIIIETGNESFNEKIIFVNSELR